MDRQSLDADVKLAAGGDRDALQRLLVHYDPILRGKLTPRIGAEFARLIEIDDVLQEVYISANDALSAAKFENAAGFYKWIEQIAANDLIDMQRRLTRQKRDIRRQVTADTRQSLIAIVERIAGGEPTPSRHLAKDEGRGGGAVMSGATDGRSTHGDQSPLFPARIGRGPGPPAGQKRTGNSRAVLSRVDGTAQAYGFDLSVYVGAVAGSSQRSAFSPVGPVCNRSMRRPHPLAADVVRSNHQV